MHNTIIANRMYNSVWFLEKKSLTLLYTLSAPLTNPEISQAQIPIISKAKKILTIRINIVLILYFFR